MRRQLRRRALVRSHNNPYERMNMFDTLLRINTDGTTIDPLRLIIQSELPKFPPGLPAIAIQPISIRSEDAMASLQTLHKMGFFSTNTKARRR